MSSQADTLKIARADIAAVGSYLFEAQNADRGDARAVRAAILLLERTAGRLRKSFSLEVEQGDAD